MVSALRAFPISKSARLHFLTTQMKVETAVLLSLSIERENNQRPPEERKLEKIMERNLQLGDENGDDVEVFESTKQLT